MQDRKKALETPENREKPLETREKPLEFQENREKPLETRENAEETHAQILEDREKFAISGSFPAKTGLDAVSKRFGIKETEDLFEAEENEDEDPLFTNKKRKSLSTLFRAVEVSPKKRENPPENSEILEENPRLFSRPSLRQRDFEEIPPQDRSSSKFFEENAENSQKVAKNSGILLRNMRKSHTFKEKEQEIDGNSGLDHEILMEKPVIRNKKRGPPTFFRDEDEEEEQKSGNRESFSRNFPKNAENFEVNRRYTQQQDKKSQEIASFEREKLEERLLVGKAEGNSKKLERLFEEDEDSEELFNKPVTFVAKPQKNQLFDDDDDEEWGIPADLYKKTLKIKRN